MRLAELDEEVVKVHPLLISSVSDQGPETGRVDTVGAQVTVSIAK